MTVYYMVIATCFLLYVILYKGRVNLNKKLIGDEKVDLVEFPKHRYIYFAVMSIFLIAIMGLRRISVGIDTYYYYNAFSFYRDIPFNYLVNADLTEIGYAFTAIIFNKIGLDFQAFLVATAFFYIGTVTYIIVHNSKSPWLSYFIFIAFGYFTFGMTGIRQTIAMSFTLLAFIMIQKKKLVPFILFVWLASTFHITAWIFLPAYFLDKLKLNRKTIVLLTIIGIILFLAKDAIGGILNSHARIKYIPTETGGTLMYIFLLGTVLIGLILGKVLDEKNRKEKIFFYMIVASTILFPIVQFNPVTLRLHFYYSVLMIIYIPNMLASIQDKLTKLVGYIAYISVGIYSLYSQVFVNGSQFAPYLFFWQ